MHIDKLKKYVTGGVWFALPKGLRELRVPVPVPVPIRYEPINPSEIPETKVFSFDIYCDDILVFPGTKTNYWFIPYELIDAEG